MSATSCGVITPVSPAALLLDAAAALLVDAAAGAAAEEVRE
jgi:hypothetical protein